MELKKAIEIRTSVRSFAPDHVPVDDVREMIRLAGLAPSVNNFQPWNFIFVTSKKKMNDMADVISARYEEFPMKDSKLSKNVRNQVEWYSTFFKDAPALLAVAIEEYESVWEKGAKLSHEEINEMRNYPDIQSAGACIQNLLLAAVDMGYGACWLSGPMVAKNELELMLEIKKPSSLLSFIAIGKPAKDIKPKEKENLADRMRTIE